MKKLLTLALTLVLITALTPAPATTTVPLYGDVDGDGVITAADITLLRRYIAANDKPAFLFANPRFNLENARLFGQNGEPTAADVARLRKYVAGFGGHLGSTLFDDAIVFSIRPAVGTPETLAVGENFTMEIHMANPSGKSIGSISYLGIKFDKNMVQWNLDGEYNPDMSSRRPFRVGNVPSDFRLRFLPPNEIFNDSGDCVLGDFNAFFSFDSQWDYTGLGGVLMTLDFTAKTSTTFPIFTLSISGMANFDDETYAFGTEYGFLPGTLFVPNDTSDYIPITPAAAIQPPFYGDVNGNGRVDSADVTMLRRRIAQGNANGLIGFNAENADVNADGEINATDVTLLRRYVAASDRANIPLGPLWPVASQPTIRPRSDWNARTPSTMTAREGAFRVIFHHPAGGGFNSTDLASVRDEIRRIQNDHMDKERWADIGYHYLIDPAGRIWEGRQLQFQGAHTSGYNHDIGVSILGDFEPRIQNQWSANVLNQNQKNAMIALTRWLCYSQGLHIIPSAGTGTGRENAQAPLTTHRRMNTGTVCPGRNAAVWIEDDLWFDTLFWNGNIANFR
jgi:hypothetical protein